MSNSKTVYIGHVIKKRTAAQRAMFITDQFERLCKNRISPNRTVQSLWHHIQEDFLPNVFLMKCKNSQVGSILFLHKC